MKLRVFASMKSCTCLKMGGIGSKRSLGKKIEYPMLVTKGLLLIGIPHNPESSDERLQGHHGPPVY